MLNKDGIRELAYIVKIDEIKPHPNADRLEIAVVGGWEIIVGLNEFKAEDLGIYFEIDSKLPEKKPFTDMEFLASKHYKVKIQKIRQVYSQGLLIHVDAFAGTEFEQAVGYAFASYNAGDNTTDTDGKFLTKQLEVTYAVSEDNKRKANHNKYDGMKQRHKKLFKRFPFKYLMRYEWGRKFLFLFFGKKRDSKKSFPTHFQYIHKSDEERLENMTWILEDTQTSWTKTCKVDGTSSTYILERKPFGKFEFYVLSRNVRQFKEDQECYHEFNVYWYNANKYHIREFLDDMLKKNPNWNYCCIQGESAGGDSEHGSIQGNPHKLKEVCFFGFNFIDSEHGRWNTKDAQELATQYDIPWVPIIDTNYHVINDLETMKLDADGPCDIPGSSGKREGFVYRENTEYNPRSFKNVSREYMLKSKEEE